MIRKNIFSGFIILLLLLAISCSKKDPPPPVFETIKTPEVIYSAMDSAQLFSLPKVYVPSENITRKVYNNVYEITNDNVIRRGNDFLINIPVPINEQLPVFYVSAKISMHLLSEMYPERDTIIVIRTFKNSAKNIRIYEIDRKYDNIKIDSISRKLPEMKFAVRNNLKKKEKIIFYREGFGSHCCPKDKHYDLEITPEKFRSNFEKANKVKIPYPFVKACGPEGEHSYNYTLKGLSDQLKLKFIQERELARKLEPDKLGFKPEPIIYTPYIVNLEEMNY